MDVRREIQETLRNEVPGIKSILPQAFGPQLEQEVGRGGVEWGDTTCPTG